MSEFIKIKFFTEENDKITVLVKKYNSKTTIYLEKKPTNSSEKLLEKLSESKATISLLDMLKRYYHNEDNEFDINSLLNLIDRLIKEANYNGNYKIYGISIGLHLLENKNHKYLFDKSLRLMKSHVIVHFSYDDEINPIENESNCCKIILSTNFRNHYSDETIKKILNGKN